MLLDHLKTRYTAKWWDPVPLENEKVQTILEAAYLAPSKQGNHDFKIYVITDSPEGKEFKQWLYWDNTSCLNKVRGAQGEGLRRYNGQVLAPVVMVWLGKNFSTSQSDYIESPWLRTNNDCIISSTMAMCQAEELGVNTGFCGCIGGKEIANKLNEPEYTAVISMGFGYATPDTTYIRKVFDSNDVEKGFDLANTDASIRDFENRKNRPPLESSVTYL